MKLKLEAHGQEFSSAPTTVTWQTAIQYALAIGARIDDLELVWEQHPNFRVFPTYAVVPTFPVVIEALVAVNADMTRLVHGAQTVELHKPIPLGRPLATRGKIVEILDKGKGAVVNIETETQNGKGDLIFSTSWSIFCRGQGDFGGERGTTPTLPDCADRPAWTGEATTTPEQAAFYRLTGDANPLHIDPKLAEKVGFRSPILHGLCTYGQVARTILKEKFDGQWDCFQHFSARFSREVYPGDTISINATPSVEDNQWRVEASVEDRTVLSHGLLSVK